MTISVGDYSPQQLSVVIWGYKMKIIKSNTGFTLIEVVIALGVLSIGILGLMVMQLSAIKGNSTANTITAESNWAADRIELVLDLDFFHADLLDTDNDGTNRDNNRDGFDDADTDVNADGIIDDVAYFGLNDLGSSAPAGCIAAPADNCLRQGDYDIFWNIAVNHPVPYSKKIKVIVIDNRQAWIVDPVTLQLVPKNKVEFEYVKADVI